MANKFPDALSDLADVLAQLPGIGKRTAERLAFSLYEWEDSALNDFGRRLQELHERVHACVRCGNLADNEICRICMDPTRDQRTICVVETARQVPVIEGSNRYRGLYHILGGRLAPLDGVDVEDLNFESLRGRIQELSVSEVILATSSDVEGEATAAFVAEELRLSFDLNVTRLAQGIPVGADLLYADAASMAMAIQSRRTL